MAIKSVIEEWLEWLSLNKGRSDATIIKYRGYLLEFESFLEDCALDDVDLKLLEQFTGKFLFEKGLVSGSRSAAIAAIRNFFAWVTKKGFISRNPAEDLAYPTLGRRLPRAISLQDAEKLLNSIDLDSFQGVRDAAMLAVLIGCGLRVSGLCNLNQSSLIFGADDKGRERLYIRAKEKGSKERIVPAPTETMLLIRAYLGHVDLERIDRTLKNGDQVLFVSVGNKKVPIYEYIGEARRISPRSINDILSKHADAAGVSAEFAHPHAFRHLYGAELMESDATTLSAQALMGHEDPKTTEIYSHLAMRKLTDVVDRSNPLGKIHTPVSDLVKHLNT
ncbi:MAG: tyrosine-type recombinase/integrase [Gammaproteobacteria bacterium]|nr:tyrosine-type recombinase/integrase [Gammaproteobacteria bacterium]